MKIVELRRRGIPLPDASQHKNLSNYLVNVLKVLHESATMLIIISTVLLGGTPQNRHYSMPWYAMAGLTSLSMNVWFLVEELLEALFWS